MLSMLEDWPLAEIRRAMEVDLERISPEWFKFPTLLPGQSYWGLALHGEWQGVSAVELLPCRESGLWYVRTWQEVIDSREFDIRTVREPVPAAQIIPVLQGWDWSHSDVGPMRWLTAGYFDLANGLMEAHVDRRLRRVLCGLGVPFSVQVKCHAGRADLVTRSYVIEVEPVLDRRHVFESIGQVLSYRTCIIPRRQAAIVGYWHPFVDVIRPVLAQLEIEVWAVRWPPEERVFWDHVTDQADFTMWPFDLCEPLVHRQSRHQCSPDVFEGVWGAMMNKVFDGGGDVDDEEETAAIQDVAVLEDDDDQV